MKFVDYMFENMDTYDATAVDCLVFENFQVGNKCMEERSSRLEAEICEKVKVQRGSNPESVTVVPRRKYCVMAGAIKESFMSSRTNYGSNYSLRGCKICEELTMVVTKGRTMSKDPDDCRDRLNGIDCPL